jgi:hypothetical protein
MVPQLFFSTTKRSSIDGNVTLRNTDFRANGKFLTDSSCKRKNLEEQKEDYQYPSHNIYDLVQKQN